jgi:hypothetical protein
MLDEAKETLSLPVFGVPSGRDKARGGRVSADNMILTHCKSHQASDWTTAVSGSQAAPPVPDTVWRNGRVPHARIGLEHRRLKCRLGWLIRSDCILPTVGMVASRHKLNCAGSRFPHHSPNPRCCAFSCDRKLGGRRSGRPRGCGRHRRHEATSEPPAFWAATRA